MKHLILFFFFRLILTLLASHGLYWTCMNSIGLMSSLSSIGLIWTPLGILYWLNRELIIYYYLIFADSSWLYWAHMDSIGLILTQTSPIEPWWAEWIWDQTSPIEPKWVRYEFGTRWVQWSPIEFLCKCLKLPIESNRVLLSPIEFLTQGLPRVS